ncbi:hypothetical protein [Ornithinimicrobium cerasi]|uniref:hypothetical protein n=1 Tax=Ornithinimicrobium cerasi TaxID=2248773 RepID=UPI000EFE66C4|nr:hypothetical protein [Ornithinimicrobium cerasi]
MKEAETNEVIEEVVDDVCVDVLPRNPETGSRRLADSCDVEPFQRRPRHHSRRTHEHCDLTASQRRGVQATASDVPVGAVDDTPAIAA